jgi:hypothetical protein
MIDGALRFWGGFPHWLMGLDGLDVGYLAQA